MISLKLVSITLVWFFVTYGVHCTNIEEEYDYGHDYGDNYYDTIDPCSFYGGNCKKDNFPTDTLEDVLGIGVKKC